MQSSLKKTLYLGLAAISLGAVAGLPTQAQAKSSAKVTSNQALKTEATTRNVNLTGTNAIYSKPGTVKGAQVVATTTTAKNISTSTSSHKNFRAYRVAKTNRGSVYYKVVSFDKSYRGWVYGGTSETSFGGGVASYNTFTAGTMTENQKTGIYKLATPGKTDAGSTYKAPAWTQYKIGRAILDTTAYKNATFTIDQVGTRTREGDTWVHVVNKDAKDTKANGWILESNLSLTNKIADNMVRINLVGEKGESLGTVDYTKKDAKLGDTLGELSALPNKDGVYGWQLGAAQGNIETQIKAKLANTGYVFNNLTDAQIATLAQAKTGTAVNLDFAKGNTVYSKFAPTSREAGKNSSQSNAMKAVSNAKDIPANALVEVTAADKDTDAKLKNLSILYNKKSTDDAAYKEFTGAINALVTKGTDGKVDDSKLVKYNAEVAASAAVTYLSPSDMKVTDLFSGADGASYTSAQALAYLKGNKELSNLKSAVYPVFKTDGTHVTISWKQLAYTPSDADKGTFGKVSNAIFDYDFSKAASVAEPKINTVQPGNNGTTNPLV